MSIKPALSEVQKRFLLYRFTECRSDAEAERKIGAAKGAAKQWKSRSSWPTSPDFKTAYAEAKARAEAVVEEINKETFAEEELVEPAMLRLRELLNIPIRSDTKSGVMGQIRMASEAVLKGRGYLSPDEVNTLNLNVVAGEFIDAGVTFRPAWMASSEEESSPHDELAPPPEKPALPHVDPVQQSALPDAARESNNPQTEEPS